MIEKIISGGQTGVDIAALDAAIMFRIPHGGWCPPDRKNEKGVIPKEYELREIPGSFKGQESYDDRTKKNVEDSDGTLIFIPEKSLLSEIKDGTKLIVETVKSKQKPCLEIDLSESLEKNIEKIVNWLKEKNIKVLNIAGPRESTSPGIYQLTIEFLEKFLPELGYFQPSVKIV